GGGPPRRVPDPLPAGDVDHDAVEDVLALVLEHVADLADLDPVGRPHGRAPREDLVGDGVTVVVSHPAVATAETSVAATSRAVIPMIPRSPAWLFGISARARPAPPRGP